MPRLFIAMDPPDDVRADLAGVRFDLRGMRRLPPEQFHLTLRFLGDVPEERTLEVAETLERIDGNEVEVGLEGIDVFPSRRRPRVLVARLSEAPELHALQSAIEAAMVEIGFLREDRPFTSHITLARFRDVDIRRLAQQLEHSVAPRIRFRMDAFFLYESRLFPSGARYTRLRRFHLGERAGPNHAD